MITADEALAAHDDKGECKSMKAEAIEFLQTTLANGPVAADDVQKDGRGAGITPKALRSAREALGIKPEKSGFGSDGQWVWALPKMPSDPKMPTFGNGHLRTPEGILGVEDEISRWSEE